jgi:hypothetical protein
MSVKEKQLDFKKLIANYKQETFKSMPTLNHEFLYSCFSPKDSNQIINLEHNNIPPSIQIYDLKFEPNPDNHLDEPKDTTALNETDMTETMRKKEGEFKLNLNGEYKSEA